MLSWKEAVSATNPEVGQRGSKGRILVVGQERSEGASLAAMLRDEGYEAATASNPFKGLGRLTEFAPQLILADARMPGMDGTLFTEKVRESHPGTGVIVMANGATVEEAVRTLRCGAEDYLEKPLDVPALVSVIERTLEKVQLRMAARRPTPIQPEEPSALANIVADHPSMQRVLSMIERVAPTTVTVLVSGETGTGKELAAAAIHGLSPRASGPFVKLNCAALADSILERELFGHERGAFNGAITRREGRFEQADGGTLLLAEVSEISDCCQVKLLRFLQEHEFERVGGNETRRVDVRLIASTDRNLPEAVAAGRFRKDLFYRLNVVHIEMPPLRERRSDLRALATALLARYAKLHGQPLEGFTNEAFEMLMCHQWPGNVHELENAIERAVVLATDCWIRPEHLPPSIGGRQRNSLEAPIPGSTLAEIERLAILKSLEAVGGSTMQAACMLDISQRKIQYRLREYGMRDAQSSDHSKHSRENADSAGDPRPSDWSEAQAYSCTPEPSAGRRSRRCGASGVRS